MLVEDDDTVKAIVLGDVRGGNGVFAPDTPEGVCRCPFIRSAERVFDGLLYLALQVYAHPGVRGARGPQLVKEGTLQGNAVRHLDHPLLPHGVYGAEGTLDPVVHSFRRDQKTSR